MADLYKRLVSACKSGDEEFIFRCITKDKDRIKNIDWRDLLFTANDHGHGNIVQCIWNSGLVALQDRLLCACKSGDVEFVSHCIADIKNANKDRNIIRRNALCRGDQCDHTDIMRCIFGRGEEGIDDALARVRSVLGDHLGGVLGGVLADVRGDGDVKTGNKGDHEVNKDRDSEVDWDGLLMTAYGYGHRNIVQCIQDSGRLGLDEVLFTACLNGDVKFVSRVIRDTDRGMEEDFEKVIAFVPLFLKRNIDKDGKVTWEEVKAFMSSVHLRKPDECEELNWEKMIKCCPKFPK